MENHGEAPVITLLPAWPVAKIMGLMKTVAIIFVIALVICAVALIARWLAYKLP